jgi:hypothetical protein
MQIKMLLVIPALAWLALPLPALQESEELLADAMNPASWSSDGVLNKLSREVEGSMAVLRWTASEPGTEWWSLQIAYHNVPAPVRGETTLSFLARADRTVDLQFNLMYMEPPWTVVTAVETRTLTTAWQTFEIPLHVYRDGDNVPVRLNISSANMPCICDFVAIKLTKKGGQ